jgi:GAF domain-containing protein
MRRLNLVDTLAEERFDRLTRIAAALLDAPIAFVGLIDRDREWFKSKVGLEASEVPRELSFCAHAILSDDTLVVRDATLDGRFAGNPMVTGPQRVRFYAGVPLRLADGARVGTLCVVDHRPRDVSEETLARLRDLAAIAERELQTPLGPRP